MQGKVDIGFMRLRTRCRVLSMVAAEQGVSIVPAFGLNMAEGIHIHRDTLVPRSLRLGIDWKSELDRRAEVAVRRRPQPAAMSFNDGSAN